MAAAAKASSFFMVTLSLIGCVERSIACDRAPGAARAGKRIASGGGNLRHHNARGNDPADASVEIRPLRRIGRGRLGIKC
jgi:hypothetical protein